MPRNDKNMPAVTTSVVATGAALAGLGMSAAQAVQANKSAKQAAEGATKAATTLEGMKEQNALAGLQVPTLGFDLAQQGLDRATQAALTSVQGAGAEGVIGGVGQITQAANEQELQLAAQANQLEYQRDLAQAETQQGINTRKFKQLSELELSKLTGAQLTKYQAELNKQKDIENAVASGISALGYGAEMVPLYMKQKQPKSTSSGFSAPLYSLGLPQ